MSKYALLLMFKIPISISPQKLAAFQNRQKHIEGYVLDHYIKVFLYNKVHFEDYQT